VDCSGGRLLPRRVKPCGIRPTHRAWSQKYTLRTLLDEGEGYHAPDLSRGYDVSAMSISEEAAWQSCVWA